MRSGKNPLSPEAIKALGPDEVPSLAILATITVLESMTDDERAELKDYKANPTAGQNFLSTINDNVLEKLVLWSDENGLLLSFFAACKRGLAELVHYYILKKVDVHTGGDKALRLAAEKGHTKTVKVLLAADANIHADDDCALRYAAEGGQTETVQILLAADANVRAWNDFALRRAAENGHTKTVEVLLEAGADVHAVDDYALRGAARNGHLETVKVLLAAGADVHAGSDKALRGAACNGQTETVKVLLAAGGDVHADNDIALRWTAMGTDCPEVVKVLLAAGANVHAQDGEAFRVATRNVRPETVKVLLAAGADIHARDDDALRVAAAQGRTEMVKVLLDAGADVHALNDFALLEAAKKGHTETVEVLLAARADVHADDDEALRVAAQYGRAETVQVLKHWIANERVLVDLCRSYPPIKESILQQLIQSDNFKQSLANPSSYVENDRQGCPIEQQVPLCFPNSPLSLSVKGDGPWTLMHYLKEEAKQNPNTERLIALPLHVAEQVWVSLVLYIDKGNRLSSICLMACPSNSSQSPQAFNDLLDLIHQQLLTHYPKFDRGIHIYSMPQKKLPTSDQEAPRVSTAVSMTSNLQRMVRLAYFGEDFTLIERQRNDKPSAPSTSTSSTFNTDLFKPGASVGNEARNDDDNNESGSTMCIIH